MRGLDFVPVVSPIMRRGAGAAVLAALPLLVMSNADATDRAVVGEWALSHHESDVLPVHAALLPDETPRVLIMAGSGNDPTFSRGVNEARLWNSITGEVEGAPGETPFAGASIPDGDPATLHDNDVFCSAHVFLPNGNLFVAGGNLEYPNLHGGGPHPAHVTPPNYDSPEARPACHDFLGLRGSFIYDANAVAWSRGPKMQRGRWYPSALSLGDGRVLLISGLDDIGQGGLNGQVLDGFACQGAVLNRTAEIYNPATGAWSAPVSDSGAGKINADNLGLYPYVHLLPTGKVFLAAPTSATEVFDADTLMRDGAQKFSQRGGYDYGFSTLLALRPSEGYRARVFNAGGSTFPTGVTNKTEIIDFSAANPQWTLAKPMTDGRSQGASVLLPDGKLLVIGGTSGGDTNNNAILEAEIYDPATDTWTSAGQSVIPRMYHSTAILLPDGRVWVAGSNPHDTLDVNERTTETRIELYSPAYLFKGAQGNIPVHPEEAQVGTSFNIRMATLAQATKARQIVLLRNGSTTHTRNFDQRLVELTFTRDPVSGRVLNVQAPPNGYIAPPGPYMMYVIDDLGVPSYGHTIRITN
jgi:hypothetical protein